ncbi:hypothetical protein PITC_040250 [Penicillium italicum]|uniref:Uncharacterized protein n=1 Tax=Penicillium italicum TaxID=40296 RepID=A0A0A2LDV2_PENIT|nr:hypothetical protein PITC_040250 [Penicillium italicum]
MGRVSRFTYFTLETRIIRLEDLSEKKASKSSKTESSWWVFAQLLRMIGQFVMRSAQDPNYIPWVQNMIDLDIRLREIVQREEFLISQCEKAEKLLDGSTKEQQQLDEWHTELQNLERSYWTAERMLCANDRLCPDGPSWRAYLSLRKSPQWYLTSWLIDDSPYVPRDMDIAQKRAAAVSKLGGFPWMRSKRSYVSRLSPSSEGCLRLVAITTLEKFFGVGTRPLHVIGGGIGLLFLVVFLALVAYMAVTWWKAFLANKYIDVETLPANAAEEDRQFAREMLHESRHTWPRRAAHRVGILLKENETDTSTTSTATTTSATQETGLWTNITDFFYKFQC